MNKLGLFRRYCIILWLEVVMSLLILGLSLDYYVGCMLAVGILLFKWQMSVFRHFSEVVWLL